MKTFALLFALLSASTATPSFAFDDDAATCDFTCYAACLNQQIACSASCQGNSYCISGCDEAYRSCVGI